jgi:hypothetical protein
MHRRRTLFEEEYSFKKSLPAVFLTMHEYYPEFFNILLLWVWICFTSQTTPSPLITGSQVSPLSVDIIIFLILIATSTPSNSAKFPSIPWLCTRFQVFPLSAVLKRPPSVLMKIVPPAVKSSRQPLFIWIGDE